MRLRLPNLHVVVVGDLPPVVRAALSDLEDERLYVPTEARSTELHVEMAGAGWKISAPTGGFEHLGAIESDSGPADLLDAIVGRLNRLSYEADPTRLHLHGAAIEINGVGIALIGRSGSGKSTLTTCLLKGGAKYLTDECVTVLPGARTVFGFPKPITLKSGSVRYLQGRDIGLGLCPTSTTGRLHVAASSVSTTVPYTTLGLVVAVRFEDGAPSYLRPMSSAEAGRILLGDSLDAARMGPVALDVVATQVAHAGLWELTYSDAIEAAQIIADLPVPSRSRLAARFMVSGEIGIHGPSKSDAYQSNDPSVRLVSFEDSAIVWDGANGQLRVLTPDAAQSYMRDSTVAPVATWVRSVADLAETDSVASLSASRLPSDLDEALLTGTAVNASKTVLDQASADLIAKSVVAARVTGAGVVQLRRAGLGDDAAFRVLADAHVLAQRRSVFVERELRRVVSLLEPAGIQAIVLGGIVAAWDGLLPTYLFDLEAPFLLVPVSDLGRAVDLVDDDWRFRSEIPLERVLTNDRVDIARPEPLTPRVVADVPGAVSAAGINFEALVADAVPLRIGHQWYRALHPCHRFLVSCLRAGDKESLGELEVVREIAATAPMGTAEVDAIVETARRWAISDAVNHALEITDAAFEGRTPRGLVAVLQSLKI